MTRHQAAARAQIARYQQTHGCLVWSADLIAEARAEAEEEVWQACLNACVAIRVALSPLSSCGGAIDDCITAIKALRGED